MIQLLGVLLRLARVSPPRPSIRPGRSWILFGARLRGCLARPMWSEPCNLFQVLSLSGRESLWVIQSCCGTRSCARGCLSRRGGAELRRACWEPGSARKRSSRPSFGRPRHLEENHGNQVSRARTTCASCSWWPGAAPRLFAYELRLTSSSGRGSQE